MRRKLPSWILVYNMTHESYGGNTHRDGQKTVTVEARHEKSAMRKGRTKVERESRGYNACLVSVTKS